MDAFSTDRARQEGLRSAIYPLAARDPDQARALIDTYMTDAATREQAEQMLENAIERGGFANRFIFR